jgi:hypothetical protein
MAFLSGFKPALIDTNNSEPILLTLDGLLFRIAIHMFFLRMEKKICCHKHIVLAIRFFGDFAQRPSSMAGMELS